MSSTNATTASSIISSSTDDSAKAVVFAIAARAAAEKELEHALSQLARLQQRAIAKSANLLSAQQNDVERCAKNSASVINPIKEELKEDINGDFVIFHIALGRSRGRTMPAPTKWRRTAGP
jgi:hypothetical protein